MRCGRPVEGVYAIRVGVALSRPPREDTYLWVLVGAACLSEAQIVACQVAATHPRVVMAVSTELCWYEE